MTQWTRAIAEKKLGRAANETLAGKGQHNRTNPQPRPEGGLHFCHVFKTELIQDVSCDPLKDHGVS